MPPRRPASPASPLPTARDLALPRSARDLYTRLTTEQPGTWPDLLASCREHVQRFKAACDQRVPPGRRGASRWSRGAGLVA